MRISRCIRGQTTLTRAQLEAGEKFDDVIAVEPRLESLPHGEQRVEGVSEIPYGIMIPRGVELLLVASGKTVSTEPRGILRGQVPCMALGQAAGIAAALAARNGTSPSQIPARQVQQALLKQAAYLGRQARLAELGLG